MTIYLAGYRPNSHILTGNGASFPLTLTHILGGKLSSCSQLVSKKQNLQVSKKTWFRKEPIVQNTQLYSCIFSNNSDPDKRARKGGSVMLDGFLGINMFTTAGGCFAI